MMLPDRHIHIDAQQLQAIFDAEAQRTVMRRLRDTIRGIEAQAEMPLGFALLILPALAAIAAFGAALARGMA